MPRVYASLATLLALKGERLPLWMRLTAYVLIDHVCEACCAYCWLSRAARRHRIEGRVKLARVTWYPVELEEYRERLRVFARICIQGVVSPYADERIYLLVKWLRATAGYRGGVSVAHIPRKLSLLKELRELGVDYYGVGLDVASEEAARRLKKPLPWDKYIQVTRYAVSVFGEGHVYVHLIAGLGETADELAKAMRMVYSIGARVALFAYTPGGVLGGKSPELCYYRGAQVYRQLLDEGLEPEEYIQPAGAAWRVVKMPSIDVLLRSVVTSGCPACNRPYYNESPRGPVYNYPVRPTGAEAENVLREFKACFSSSRVRDT